MTVLTIALAITTSALLYLVYVLAERNRRLTAKCKDQRDVIANMADGWIDDGEVRVMPTSSSIVSDPLTYENDWLVDHPGVNPVRERGEK